MYLRKCNFRYLRSNKELVIFLIVSFTLLMLFGYSVYKTADDLGPSSKFMDPTDILKRRVCKGFGKKLHRPDPMDVEKYYKLDCTKPFVVFKENGRLGNAVLEYLTIATMQKIYGFPAAIDDALHRTVSGLFNTVNIPTVPKRSNCIKSVEKSLASLENKLKSAISNDRSRTNVEDILEGQSLISGWPYQVKKLLLYPHFLKGEMKLHPNIKRQAEIMLEYILGEKRMEKWEKKKVTLVSIHVRRGDFQHWMLDRFTPGRILLTQCYFESAMEYFREKYRHVFFVVFGTDMKWNKLHLEGEDVVFSDPKSYSDFQPELDFVMISMCDHHIMSLGTFSFASSFIGSGSVVYPLVTGKRLMGTEKAILCSENVNFIPINDCGIK